MIGPKFFIPLFGCNEKSSDLNNKVDKLSVVVVERPISPPVIFNIPELASVGQGFIVTLLLIVVVVEGQLPGIIGPIGILPDCISFTKLQNSLSYPLLLK